MTPGDREYRNETLPLSSLFVTSDVVQGVTFTGCTLIGPGIVTLLGHGVLNECTWDAPGHDMFWIYPDDREFLVGVMGFDGCEFYNCRFQRVGLAIARRQVADTYRGFGLSG